MSQESSRKGGPESLLAQWITTASEFWQKMSETFPAGGPRPEDLKPPFSEPVEFFSILTRAFTQGLGGPARGDTFFPDSAFFDEIFTKMAGQLWNGVFELQRLWREQDQLKPGAFQFTRLDREQIKGWLAAYEEHWQPLLQMPQLGLTRVYQEKTARLADTFQIFQGALADHLYLLYLPVEQSLLIMQENLAETVRQGQSSHDFKDCYKGWLKILEGHYMTLSKEPEYLHSMARVLGAMEEFMAARQEVLTAFLKNLSIPTHEELDELYLELYQLKKKVKDLAKSQKSRKTPKRSPSAR